MTRDIEIEEVQTARIRQKAGAGDSWSPLISATRAIKAAGLADAESIYWDLANAQQGMAPALDENADHRIERTIMHAGSGGATLQLLIPDEVIEELGITRDEIDSDDPPEVTIYAGPGVIAIERTTKRVLTLESDPDAN